MRAFGQLGPTPDGSSRSRVLFVSHSAEWTGPTNSLFLLLKHLRTRFEVSVLLPGHGALSALLDAEGIPYFSMRSLRKFQIPRMLYLMRKQRVQLVYANNTSSASKNALIAAKLLRIPFIYHIRAMARRATWRKVRFVRFADASIAVSDATARSFSRFMDGRMPHVVHNGVPCANRLLAGEKESARQDLKDELNVPAKATVLISVGNICRRKAPEYAVRAFARLFGEAEDAFLLLVGRWDRDPDYVRRLRVLVRALGVEDRVQLLGFRNDVTRLLAASDVFVHTALEDPHPRVVIEAMAAGLPVVAFSVDGVAETVLDCETGYLIQAGDLSSLTSAMRVLVRDRAVRSKFGRNGQRRVARHFSDEGTAQKVGEIIDLTIRR